MYTVDTHNIKCKCCSFEKIDSRWVGINYQFFCRACYYYVVLDKDNSVITEQYYVDGFGIHIDYIGNDLTIDRVDKNNYIEEYQIFKSSISFPIKSKDSCKKFIKTLVLQ